MVVLMVNISAQALPANGSIVLLLRDYIMFCPELN
jgi:hypothetical protein